MSRFIFSTEDIIRKPTKINAGAVADTGIAVKIGARKGSPVTTEASPVFAPAPAGFSMYVVVVDVSRTAPIILTCGREHIRGLAASGHRCGDPGDPPDIKKRLE